MNFKYIFRKSIFIAASPNSQLDDAFLAFKFLLQPWNWNNNKYNNEFSESLKEYIGVKNLKLIDSGRSALLAILKSLNLSSNDEVIIPSFTCVVVANAVSWSGAKPIYLDTNVQDFNSNYSTLPNVITKNTKAIVVQHTFGKIIDIDEIKLILKNLNRKDILIIEDYAHTIKKDMGIKGDFAFLTFGIEKVISSVRGGAILTDNNDLYKNVSEYVNSLSEFPTKKLIICLLNPIFWWFAIPLHSIGIGRFSIGALIRSVWRKLGFLGIMVEPSENLAKKPDWFPAQMSSVLSQLGLKQLHKLNKYNEHRLKISKIYFEYLNSLSDSKEFDNERVYLRFPILLNSKEEYYKVWNVSRKLRVTPGNWFSKPLYGAGVNNKTYSNLLYNPKTTPITLKKCSLVLNLPTSINISEERAKELAIEIRAVLTV